VDFEVKMALFDGLASEVNHERGSVYCL